MSKAFISSYLLCLAISMHTYAEPYVITSNDENWAPIEQSLKIKPGSVFDFSSLIDAPAGKHGFVVCNDQGSFVFEDQPEREVRFWGVNLCFTTNYPSKKQADELAENLARSGYNTIRIHHYDRYLQIKGNENSYELNEENLDKLDYLIAALKQRGIYIMIDLYCNRVFTESELNSMAIKGGSGMSQRFKAIFPISEAAFKEWAVFAENLLTHVNPYTGLSLANDPVLIGICPVNEDTLAIRLNYDPDIRKQYEALFATKNNNALNDLGPVDPSNFGRKNYAEVIDSNESDTSADNNSDFNRFIYDLQMESDKMVRRYLRELGVKAPITGANFYSYQGQTWLRDEYDFVDNHLYVDHPKHLGKGWSLPYGFHHSNPVSRAVFWAPRGMMPTRVIGKPFVTTEFRIGRPNRYRAQAGIIMPAYASLQAWDGIYTFDYSYSREILDGSGTGSAFSLVTDPVTLLADRIGSAIFIRRDIATSESGYIAFVPEPSTAFKSLKTGFSNSFTQLGLVTRIGSIPSDSERLKSEESKIKAAVVEPTAPELSELAPWEGQIYKLSDTLPKQLIEAGLLPKDSITNDGTRYRSDTGEIELDASKSTLKVVTPRSELFVLSPDSELAGDHVLVKNGAYDACLYVLSVDGQAIGKSERLLIALLTDTLPEGITFSSENRTRLESWGALPQLVARGQAELSLHLAQPSGKKWHAWTVAMDGTRLTEVPLEYKDGRFHFEAETICALGARMAFELTCE